MSYSSGENQNIPIHVQNIISDFDQNLRNSLSNKENELVIFSIQEEFNYWRERQYSDEMVFKFY